MFLEDHPSKEAKAYPAATRGRRILSVLTTVLFATAALAGIPLSAQAQQTTLEEPPLLEDFSVLSDPDPVLEPEGTLLVEAPLEDVSSAPTSASVDDGSGLLAIDEPGEWSSTQSSSSTEGCDAICFTEAVVAYVNCHITSPEDAGPEDACDPPTPSTDPCDYVPELLAQPDSPDEAAPTLDCVPPVPCVDDPCPVPCIDGNPCPIPPIPCLDEPCPPIPCVTSTECPVPPIPCVDEDCPPIPCVNDDCPLPPVPCLDEPCPPIPCVTSSECPLDQVEPCSLPEVGVEPICVDPLEETPTPCPLPTVGVEEVTCVDPLGQLGPCEAGEIGVDPACIPTAVVNICAEPDDECMTPGEAEYMLYPEGPETENPDDPLLPKRTSSAPSAFDELAEVSLAVAGTDALNLECGTGSKNRACTVLIVHGYAGVGTGSPERSIDLSPSYDRIKTAYQNAGYNVKLIAYYGGECDANGHATNAGPTVGAYAGDSGHDHWAHTRGHTSATGCDGVSGSSRHTREADIAHLAYHFAWYVYNTFTDPDHNPATQDGVRVDIVPHSMGGLIVRYAMHKVGTDAEWPPSLLVESILDYATPHDGAVGGCLAWQSGGGTYQERQMCKWSGLLNTLRNHAQSPQGAETTKWVLISSEDDFVVNPWSAIDMDLARVYWYAYHESGGSCSSLGHNDYFGINGDGTTIDSCFYYDYSGKRNAYSSGTAVKHDPGFRAIRLGLFEAVT